jgi:hypothetical protein
MTLMPESRKHRALRVRNERDPNSIALAGARQQATWDALRTALVAVSKDRHDLASERWEIGTRVLVVHNEVILADHIEALVGRPSHHSARNLLMMAELATLVGEALAAAPRDVRRLPIHPVSEPLPETIAFCATYLVLLVM